MVAYEFEDLESGERRTFDYKPGRAPKIGRVMRRGGRQWKRLVPTLSAPVVEHIRFTSHWFPPYTEGAKHYSPEGLPRFTSLHEARDMGKRYGYDYDH